MIQEESRMKLHFESGGLSSSRSVLVTLSPCMTVAQIETYKCYNYGEAGHMSKAYPNLPKERDRWVGTVQRLRPRSWWSYRWKR
jgi:hypothetical protein